MPTERTDVTEQQLMSRRAALAMSGAVCVSALGAAGQPDPDPDPNTGQGAGGAAERPLVAFVLRHAEPAGSHTGDPGLSSDGRARGERVGAMLRSVGVQRVLSTPANRARETAEAISRVCGGGLGTYDPFEPGALAKRLIGGGGVWVVVGHSNTVPGLVRELGGDPGTDLIPADRYDEVFVVVRAGGVLSMKLHS